MPNKAPIDYTTCPMDQVNMMAPDFLCDPHPFFKRLREEAPVYRDPITGIVNVSSYEMIRKVTTKPKVFSSDFAAVLVSAGQQPDSEELAIIATGLPSVQTLLTADEPEHSRYKKLVMKAFTHKRVEQMSDYITELTNELLDKLPEGGCEFKESFSVRLPMYVIADALGVPREDYDQFTKWSDGIAARFSGTVAREDRLQAAHDLIDMQNYFVKIFQTKRENPTDDVISDLVMVDLSEEGDARKLDDGELFSILTQLLVAGNESTSSALSAGLFFLLSNPDQMQLVSRKPELVPGMVEEILRYLTPVNNMWRVVTEETTLGGVALKPNDIVIIRYGSANLDEDVFENADNFHIERENASRHMAFGVGIHSCVGSLLARKELNIAFPLLLKRLNNIHLDPSKPAPVFGSSVVLRGLTELNITYEKAD